MIRRKVPVKAAVALHGDNRLASVLMILIAVDRRVNARGSKAKRATKANEAKQGSPKRGPIFLRNFYVSLTQHISIYLKKKRNEKTCSIYSKNLNTG